MALLILFKLCRVLCMHQIDVKIVNAAPLQLILKERADFLFLVKIHTCQLVDKQVSVPWIATGQTLAERKLGLAV